MQAGTFEHSPLPENGSLLSIYFVLDEPQSYWYDQGAGASSQHLVLVFLPERSMVFKLVLIKCGQIKVIRVLAPHMKSKYK